MIPTKAPTVRLVFDRKHVATKSGVKDARKGLVQIEVMYQRKRKYISTGVKIYADQWRQNAERHVIASAYAVQYNETISNALRSVMDTINNQNGAYNIDAINTLYPGTVSVAEYAKGVIIMDGLAVNSRKRYTTAINKMGSFVRFADITQVTHADVEAFVRHLNYRPGTLRNMLTLLRKVFRTAVRDGIINKDPTDNITRPKGSCHERVRLTDEEVATIASVKLRPKQELTRAMFLFQCYTGMAWVDMTTLTPDMIVRENGHTYIVRSRQKTSVAYRTMLLKPAEEIFDRYGSLFSSKKICLYNKQLIRIAKAAGINKRISSHVGRHTFATWALSHGTPIEIVSKMLGHTNIKTTQIYAKILAKDVDAQFERLDGLF